MRMCQSRDNKQDPISEDEMDPKCREESNGCL
jgi:hypothetical protein